MIYHNSTSDPDTFPVITECMLYTTYIFLIFTTTAAPRIAERNTDDKPTDMAMIVISDRPELGESLDAVNMHT